jgi:hypothetical protein
MISIQRKLMVFLAFAVLIFAGSWALAYGPAGCGLGSLIIQKDSIVSQTLAETTNLTLWNQFFGITSGTSNCNTNGFVMREKEAEHFAEANMKNLEVEMARGHGESLSAFAQILGCKQGAISSFGHMSQSHYENIFPNATVEAPVFIKSVEKEMITDPAVRTGCLEQALI